MRKKVLYFMLMCLIGDSGILLHSKAMEEMREQVKLQNQREKVFDEKALNRYKRSIYQCYRWIRDYYAFYHEDNKLKEWYSLYHQKLRDLEYGVSFSFAEEERKQWLERYNKTIAWLQVKIRRRLSETEKEIFTKLFDKTKVNLGNRVHGELASSGSQLWRHYYVKALEFYRNHVIPDYKKVQWESGKKYYTSAIEKIKFKLDEKLQKAPQDSKTVDNMIRKVINASQKKKILAFCDRGTSEGMAVFCKKIGFFPWEKLSYLEQAIWVEKATGNWSKLKAKVRKIYKTFKKSKDTFWAVQEEKKSRVSDWAKRRLGMRSAIDKKKRLGYGDKEKQRIVAATLTEKDRQSIEENFIAKSNGSPQKSGGVHSAANPTIEATSKKAQNKTATKGTWWDWEEKAEADAASG